MHDSSQRVVITGMGAISPFGRGVSNYFTGLREGRSGIRRLSLVDDPALASQVAGEVPNFNPSAHMQAADIPRVPRLVPMAVGAAREALGDAGIDPEKLDLPERRSIGIILGTGGGGIEFAERQYEAFYGRQVRNLTPYCVSSSFVGMLSSEVSIALQLHGLSHVISTGCTSSTDAIGYAYQMIRWGRQEMLLTGGAEACITAGLMAGFCRMKVVSTRYNDTPHRASRPFDRGRDGFVLGEGAWVFAVESLARARARGARIYAEITGYGSTCDAFHRVAIRNDGQEPARAMQLAMEEAGITKDRVQYVNLHGTATAMNDPVETTAVKLAFNGSAAGLTMSATKSMIGHPQGACGAAGVMASVFALQEQFIPPTINYEEPDPACDLNYTPNRGVVRDVEYALCNTIAFGSKNSALVLRRWES